MSLQDSPEISKGVSKIRQKNLQDSPEESPRLESQRSLQNTKNYLKDSLKFARGVSKTHERSLQDFTTLQRSLVNSPGKSSRLTRKTSKIGQRSLRNSQEKSPKLVSEVSKTPIVSNTYQRSLQYSTRNSPRLAKILQTCQRSKTRQRSLQD